MISLMMYVGIILPKIPMSQGHDTQIQYESYGTCALQIISRVPGTSTVSNFHIHHLHVSPTLSKVLFGIIVIFQFLVLRCYDVLIGSLNRELKRSLILVVVCLILKTNSSNLETRKSVFIIGFQVFVPSRRTVLSLNINIFD